jgi:hypothetical protein
VEVNKQHEMGISLNVSVFFSNTHSAVESSMQRPGSLTMTFLALCHEQKAAARHKIRKTRMHLQTFDGHQELLVQPLTSTTPGTPLFCHYSSLKWLHLQLSIHLHLQPLCLHT